MNNETLELRMYGWTPYNISEIQKGIQFGHAVDQYARKFQNDELYQEWVDNHKTYIILNGGTTNNNVESKWFGGMNKIERALVENSIKHSTFCEPDLGDQLTGIALIVDERCFNKTDYPFFNEWMKGRIPNIEWLDYFRNGSERSEEAKLVFASLYNEWVDFIGGSQNVFLKELLSNYKLA